MLLRASTSATPDHVAAVLGAATHAGMAPGQLHAAFQLFAAKAANAEPEVVTTTLASAARV